MRFLHGYCYMYCGLMHSQNLSISLPQFNLIRGLINHDEWKQEQVCRVVSNIVKHSNLNLLYRCLTSQQRFDCLGKKWHQGCCFIFSLFFIYLLIHLFVCLQYIIQQQYKVVLFWFLPIIYIAPQSELMSWVFTSRF